MIRQVIEINEELCNGCKACVNACHEGAIGMKDGKAYLLRDDYCDGLGDCLPSCPTNAITFITREALEYDEEAVQKNMEAKKIKDGQTEPFTGCPGTMQQSLKKQEIAKDYVETSNISSELTSWPLQIKLVNPSAAFFDDCHLLIAADCTAFAYGNFHKDFLKNRVAIIGCPKLDENDYSEKLTSIIKNNNIKSVTVVKMEVPCCTGLANATIKALKNVNMMIPWSVKTISLNGNIIVD